jgi:hypothetical protein
LAVRFCISSAVATTSSDGRFTPGCRITNEMPATQLTFSRMREETARAVPVV